MAGHFDLALAYPQWQGSGRYEHLPLGAVTAAKICSQFARLESVGLSDDERSSNGVCRWNAIMAQFRSAQDILRTAAPKRVLTAGGDCAVDVAVIDYLIGRYPDLTVLWIDAHCDANTPNTSPSGNFHGMPVAAIMGSAPEPMQALIGASLKPERFHYFGVQVGDLGDRAFEKEHELRTLREGEILEGPVHIHFDLDVLDPTEFPYLAYTDGITSVDEALALVRRIAKVADVVGLTISEFAPRNDEEAKAGGEIIRLICDAVEKR